MWTGNGITETIYLEREPGEVRIHENLFLATCENLAEIQKNDFFFNWKSRPSGRDSSSAHRRQQSSRIRSSACLASLIRL